MSLLCQLWSLNEAIQVLKDQQQAEMQKDQQMMHLRRQQNVSPVLEDSEDLLNDPADQENMISHSWNNTIEDNEAERNGKCLDANYHTLIKLMFLYVKFKGVV